MKISLIVPVYNEEKNIHEFIRRTVPILNGITNDYEIIFGMDPSKDNTEQVIADAHAKDSRIKLLKFSRRFGQPMATLAGLMHSSGDAVIVIDVDLQDPPELIQEMVAKWREGYDVVYAQRKSRKGETFIKEVVSEIGYKVINNMTDVAIPKNTGDFRLMSRRVVEEINKLKETHGFLRGMVAIVGFKQTAVAFDRPERFSGAGNYNRFLGSLKIGLNGLFCFSNYPLFLILQMGLIIFSLSLVMGIFSMITTVLGFSRFDQWLTTFLIMFIGGIQLISVGTLGEYLGRIYDEVKQRPRFIVDKKIGL